MSTTVASVGLLSPGDMGHSVAKVLVHNGMPVYSCLAGRSQRSFDLAASAGVQTLDTMEDVVRQVDVFLSIVPPARATEVARTVAGALRSSGASLTYLDCNAISPETTKEVGRIVEGTGATFVDGGIIGPPPKIDGPTPRIYVSGPETHLVSQLRDYGLDIQPMGEAFGQASGIKMCYAALTKGLTALSTELMTAGEALGLSEALRAELAFSQGQLLANMEQQVPQMPPKAYRWIGEMEEIAKTFEDVGMTPKILLGAADMYRLVGETPLNEETPEHRTRGTDLQDVVRILSEALPSGQGSPAGTHD